MSHGEVEIADPSILKDVPWIPMMFWFTKPYDFLKMLSIFLFPIRLLSQKYGGILFGDIRDMFYFFGGGQISKSNVLYPLVMTNIAIEHGHV